MWVQMLYQFGPQSCAGFKPSQKMQKEEQKGKKRQRKQCIPSTHTGEGHKKKQGWPTSPPSKRTWALAMVLATSEPSWLAAAVSMLLVINGREGLRFTSIPCLLVTCTHTVALSWGWILGQDSRLPLYKAPVMIAEKPKLFFFFSFLGQDTCWESASLLDCSEGNNLHCTTISSLELAVIDRVHRLKHICWRCNEEHLVQLRDEHTMTLPCLLSVLRQCWSSRASMCIQNVGVNLLVANL